MIEPTVIIPTMSSRRKRGNTVVLRDDHAVIQVHSKKFGLKEILVDVADLPSLSKYTWYVHYNTFIKAFYARTRDNNSTLYTWIMAGHRMSL